MACASRLGLVTGLAVAVLCVAPAPAGAGIYTIDSCTNGSVAGWAPFYAGWYSGWGNTCGLAGGGMSATISSYPVSHAGWTFTAPADTEVAGFRLTRSFGLAAGQAFGTTTVTAMTGPSRAFYDARPNFGGSYGLGPELLSASGLRGQTTLTAQLDCGGGSSCTGSSTLYVFGASVDLRDDWSPVIGSVSGSLLAPGTLKGGRVLSYSAQDKGGGVRAEQLLVDGSVVAEREQTCSFSLPVPCPHSSSGTLALDTTRISDGEHEATLVIADATRSNRTSYGPFRFTVDNVPAPLSTSPPQVVIGSPLYADDGGWTGANLTFARRWQRLTDGMWEDIVGADRSFYTPVAADAGHRLRFRVRATNAEGSTDAFSEPTARLPDVVTPTPTVTATPTPAIVAAMPSPALPQPAPSAPARLSVAFASTGRTAVTLRWGQRRKLTGTLVRADGTPAAAGERIAITSRVRASGAVALPLGHVVADGAGRFVFLTPAGASRTLTFTRGESTATATIHVVPKITLRRTRGGGLEGRVSGAPPGVGKLVQLQALHGRTWRTFASTRLQPTGGRFSHRPRRSDARVRARVVAEPGWPFVTGTSPSVTR